MPASSARSTTRLSPMATSLEAIAADIAEAAPAGFRGRLIAQGQARAIIWRDGALPAGAPVFGPQLSYELHSYGYVLLGHGLRLREGRHRPRSRDRKRQPRRSRSGFPLHHDRRELPSRASIGARLLAPRD